MSQFTDLLATRHFEATELTSLPPGSDWSLFEKRQDKNWDEHIFNVLPAKFSFFEKQHPLPEQLHSTLGTAIDQLYVLRDL